MSIEKQAGVPKQRTIEEIRQAAALIVINGAADVREIQRLYAEAAVAQRSSLTQNQ